MRKLEGYFEGFSDAGVAFDAANVVLARFVGDDWPQDAERMTLKMQHLLSGQHSCGLFRLYPEGPCSVTATHIVCLALDRGIQANGPQVSSPVRASWTEARQRAAHGIAHPPCRHVELDSLIFFRWMLEALDSSAIGSQRLLPAPALFVLLPVMLAGLLPRSTWRRTNRIVYPFVAVLPQLVSLSAWRAAEATRAGAAFATALADRPGVLEHARERAGRSAMRWLLNRQDGTGGFYYSSLYTFLFVTALRQAADVARSPALHAQATAAAERALEYIRSRETVLPTGISTSFVASDVWDTTAVATAFLEAPPGFDLGTIDLQALGAYALAQQSPSGGFSYGRGSHFPDVDSTGLVMGLLAALLLNEPTVANAQPMVAGMVKAFDFLEKHRSATGGFNAWTVPHGERPPPVPSTVTSLLFDVSSPDVTARVMVSLSRVLLLARSSETAAAALGPERLKKLERLRQRGLRYLFSKRDSSCGLWHARWTLGYIIGTRFVFDALATYPNLGARLDGMRNEAAACLLRCQNADGGFGESSDSDTKGRFSPSPLSEALVTAAACGLLYDASMGSAPEAAARALGFLLRTQRGDGSWPERSLCTQFAGLYASYQLMTQVALTTTLFRVWRKASTE